MLPTFFFKGSKQLRKVTNHPVHIIDKDKKLSPTALIPFCEFGGNMSVMGVKIDDFKFPVCNSFRPKIIRDQLCYQVERLYCFSSLYRESLSPMVNF